LPVDNFKGATPKNRRLSLRERWMQLLRYGKQLEHKV
jgi:hypothetical protein